MTFNFNIHSITPVQGGSSPSPGPAPSTTGDYVVQVFDYDGTVIDRAYLNQGDTYTLPQAPTHEKLTFQEWTCAYPIVDNTVTVTDDNINIGAIYTTKSGNSEFDIVLDTVSGKTFSLLMNGTKNWGDGTTDTETSHTYSDYGSYTVTCDGDTITNNNVNMFDKSYTKTSHVRHVRLAKVTSLPNMALQYNVSLETVTIPNTVTTIGNGMFYDNYTLKQVSIPDGVTSVGSSLVSECYSLRSIVLPSTVTTLNDHLFQNCYSLESINIPSGITTLGWTMFNGCCSLESFKMPNTVTTLTKNTFQDCKALNSVKISTSLNDANSGTFRNCLSLSKVKIPSTLTTIPAETFYYCNSVLEYDFTDFNSVPTLSATSAFQNINLGCKIKVKSSLADTWKAATNWATYANYIVGV